MQPPQPSQPSGSVSRARGNRVFLQIPVEVYGTELSGMHFLEKCITDSVSRNGASLAIGRSLAPDQEVSIKRINNNREGLARVVGQMGKSDGKLIYGVVFVDAEEDFWGISFTESQEPAAGKVLLECFACHRQEDAALDEMELAVFMAEGRLQRRCRRCRESTIWGPVLVSDPARQEEQPKLKLGRGGANPEERRQNRRMPMLRVACIRRQSRLDVVETIDVSRTGFRFRSRLSYDLDAWIETSVPYIKDGVNIFTPARIAWVRAANDFKEYGVEYRGTQSRPAGSLWEP